MGPTLVTPDRSHNQTSRVRTQNITLSVSDVPRAALQLHKRVGSADVKANGSNHSPTLLLPQRYEMLCEFFNAMVSSIRLLRLKRLPTTLAKLSRNIESLTDRRFTLHHLGQLKHIVPEIIAVKKIRVQDDETGCMKEELLVSLEVNAVETDTIGKGSGGYSHLKGMFRSRVIDYAKTHSETDDVPEGELPELFYKPKQEPELSLLQSSTLQPAILTAPSFKRRFSSRALGTPVSSEASLAKHLPETPIKEAISVTVYSDVTPVKVASTPSKIESTSSKFESTPAKYASTPARLMSATPALRTPKRSRMTDDGPSGLTNKPVKRRLIKLEENSDDVEEQQSCEDSDSEIDSQIRNSAGLTNKPVKRRLMKLEENSDDVEEQQSCEDSDSEIDSQIRNSAASTDLLEVLPENLVHSLMKKEQRTLEEQDPIVSQARKRQQLMTGVPKLFDMIQLLFQSIRRSVITKQELIHKIITGHLDIVDRGEIEEQLKLLQEITPEFITEQFCLSGDTLLRLNKSCCAESIRAKLLEAKCDLKTYQTDC